MDKPKRKKRTVIFKNQFLEVFADELTHEGDFWTTFYWANGGKGAAIVAMDDKKRVCLLKEYRHATEAYIWSLPSGGIDEAEAPLAAAKRELKEETNLMAKRWRSLGTFYPSPGTYRQKAYLFLAQGLTGNIRKPDDKEELISGVEMVPLPKVKEMMQHGEIMDAWALIPLYRTLFLIGDEDTLAK